MMEDRRTEDPRLRGLQIEMENLQRDMLDLRKDVHALTEIMMQAKGAVLLLKILSIIVTGAAATVAWIAANTHLISFK